MKLLSLSLAIIVVFLGSCAQNPVTNQRDFVLMTEAEELSVGSQSARVIAKYFGVYDDVALQAYVRQVGHKVAAQSERPRLPWSFTVLDTPAINAFALPGGHVFVTRGLLATLRTEDQLAAAIAHQVAHVAARHHVKQHATVGGAAWQGKTVALLPGIAGQTIAVPGASSIDSPFAPEFENEAGAVTRSYLSRGGYAATALEEFHRAVASASRDTARQRGTHGLTIPTAGAAIASEQIQPESQRIENERNYLAAIEGMVVGHSAQDGQVVADQFLHLGLNIRADLPEGWHHDNQPHAVVSLSKKGGAKIELSVESRKNHVSPRAFLVRRLGAENLSKVRELDGADRSAVFATATLDRGGAKGVVRGAAIFLREAVVLLVGYPGAGVTEDAYDRQFMSTYESMAPLSEQDMQRAAVRRIEVVSGGEGRLTTTVQ